MGKSRQMAASEFKSRCLSVLDEVAQTGEEVVVTKRGRPVAKVGPVHPRKTLRGSVIWEGDIVSPLDEDWEARKR